MTGKPNAPAELEFLTSLEEGRVVTQAGLSKHIAVSIGLINALVKRAMRKGYVKAKSAPYKRYAYYLTPKGFTEKSRLVAEYLEVSLSFFRTARQQYGEIFERAHAAGIRRIAFVGTGELAEIAILSAREAEIEIVAVLDRETNKNRFHGVPVVRSFDALNAGDAVAVTDSRQPQQAFDELVEHFPDVKILAPEILRISRVRPDFKPKVDGDE